MGVRPALQLGTFHFWLAFAVGLAALPAHGDERLERLERRVEKITELTLQIDALRRENRELRGLIEVQQNAIETLKRQQRDLYKDIDERLSQVQVTADSAGAAAAAPVTERTPAASPPTPSRRAAQADRARELTEYQAAYDLLRPEQRQYAEAMAAFRTFLETYPGSELADNAQYWLAEASYVTQDNASALREFQTLLEKYPASPKVPGALLKIGYIQHAAGDLDQARATLARVTKDYPDTAAANMARQRLERIEREAR